MKTAVEVQSQADVDVRWLPVCGYEGFYSVSDAGDVKSVERTVWAGNRPYRVREKILKGSVHNGRSVLLQIEGKKKGFRVARLVFESFVGGIHDGLFILHRDGDELNCRLENLLAGDQSMAEQMKLERGRMQKSERVKDVYWSRSGNGVSVYCAT